MRFIAWMADSVIVSITIWLLKTPPWTVGVTVGSETNTVPTLEVVVARARDREPRGPRDWPRDRRYGSLAADRGVNAWHPIG